MLNQPNLLYGVELCYHSYMSTEKWREGKSFLTLMPQSYRSGDLVCKFSNEDCLREVYSDMSDIYPMKLTPSP